MQISRYKKPSTLNVQETVQEYTDLLQKLVKYEHKDDFNVDEADKVLVSLIMKKSNTDQGTITDLTIL